MLTRSQASEGTVSLDDWDDPAWTTDIRERRRAFSDKIAFLLEHTTHGIPCAVPLEVTAALAPGELPMLDLNTGQWFGLMSGRARSLQIG